MTPISSGAGTIGGFLKLPQVLGLTGLSKSTLYDKIGTGRFPQQVNLGSRLSRWRENEVAEWIRNPR